MRIKLSKEGLLSTFLRIEKEGDRAFIPIVEEGVEKARALGFEISYHTFKAPETPPRASYRDLLDLPEGLEKHLPSSFDIIGGIAVIKLPEPLLPYKKEIGRALVDFNPNIRSAYLDMGVTGDHRIRNLEHLAGENSTRTVHVEYGVKIYVDLSKAYFSPRLATEHMRVAEMVQDGERVLDMFAGVGPFSLLIAKKRRPRVVYAVDINPHATDLLRESVKANRITNIEIITADARSLPPEIRADRVIMNLPHSARSFLPHALRHLARPSAAGEDTRENRGIIHYYEILPKDAMEPRARELEEEIRAVAADIEARVRNSRIVRQYSPSEVHAAFDVEVLLP
ncbi:MAG: class I SAM-dependent methyltransferase family protein [Thermoplasmata archaeon]|nr:class I SAM-dependent methyltransferase family protein [Thermoplasmata archaeon]